MARPRFSLDLAAILFGDSKVQPVTPIEAAAVQRFRVWLDGAQRRDMHAACLALDSKLIPGLSHTSMLDVARLIEARFPEVIDNMPTLNAYCEHLNRAHQLAQVFTGPNLAALVLALQEEGER